MKRETLRKAFRRLNRDGGQGMTEYIIIVALIAIAAIGVVSVFGQNIRGLFAASVEALGGNTNVTAKTAKNATQQSGVKNLRDFGQKNK